MTKILAISSGGGHWEQLMIVRQAFARHDVAYANTMSGLAEKAGIAPAFLVTDCSRSSLRASVRSAWDILRLVSRLHPDLIVTTGALPGFLALVVGKLFGARTVWIDSVANSERLSMSGKYARYFADLHLTQWQHLVEASNTKTGFLGSVL